MHLEQRGSKLTAEELKGINRLNSLKNMNHLITAITFTIILGIVSGAPLLTCNKIKVVKQGKDNQDSYLVVMKVIRMLNI